MDRFRIDGGHPLHGTVQINGAKNAALPLLATAILTDETVVLHHLPNLGDIRTMCRLLSHLGAEWRGGETITVRLAGVERAEAPYEIVKTMRASTLVLGPLLARCGRARVSLPGGCAIGARPMGLHLQALERMGGRITIENGYIVAEARRLRGIDYTFETVTVTGTENIMMAATLADGTTTLHNAAREPEIPDLAQCLTTMGAQIHGAGTSDITIQGVTRLRGVEHTIIPDRIVAGTFAIATAMTGGDVTLQSMVPGHIEALLEKLAAAGAKIFPMTDALRVVGPPRLEAVDCTTAPFPGFATDLQAQFMAAMTIANGSSVINETVFENRFMHVGELQRMGANIQVQGSTAVVKGVPRLRGAPVMATDLRASASLVLAGLTAEGSTEIERVYHIDRGYEQIETRLGALGATMTREHGDDGH
ncbi:MAG: UDP-N-acetylglucosamine 1-carboxyvinyltransferase [Deltaproteobacteria bacterium]|nr:UDP-N-acetylglucosamine 1-carboxyvinyltransferase [Deltaproteobacteria bacterium]